MIYPIDNFLVSYLSIEFRQVRSIKGYSSSLSRGAKEDLPSQWTLFLSKTRRSISMEVDSCTCNRSTNYPMNGSHFRASLSWSTFADSSFSVPWRLTHRPIVVVRHSHSVKLLSSLWILLPIPARLRIQIRRPASRTVVIAAFTQFLVVV